MNCCKTVIVVDNKRGPQGPRGGIDEEAHATLEEIRNNVDIVEAKTNIAIEKAGEATTQAEQASRYTEEAKAAAQAATVFAEIYDEEETYTPPDMVVVNGETYRCIEESTGEYPPTSNKWILLATVAYETFELDGHGDIMPLLIPQNSSQWNIDTNGDIMPSE